MAGAINIRVSAVVSDLISAFQSGGRAAAQFADTVNRDLTTAFNAADRASRIAERGIGRLAGTFQSFGRQASIVSAGIGLLGVSSFKAYAEIDSLKRGLTAVMGSAAAAEEEFKKLRIVAALPGLGLVEAAQGSVRLQAVGFSADKAREALLQFGNAVALTGGGKAQLEQITVQLGQLAGKGKVLSQDLRPIIEATQGSITPILTKLFGTVDPEEISKKLLIAGKNSKDFVDILIGGLSELDRVAGGPKIALENFGDSVQLAGNNFGIAADKALGLTDKINGLGNLVGNLADKFATLSPFTQKVILGIVGVTAVVGPLALAVGGLLAIIPSVTAGAAALTAALGVGLGPIAAVAAGIAAAAVLIVANWDTVKSVLTQSGIWSTLTNLVSSGIETVKAAFAAGTFVLGFIWNRFSGFIVGATRVGFDGVAGVFNFAGGVLRGIMGVLTGVLTLNWSKFSTGFVDIVKSAWNLIIDIFKFGIGAVGRTLAGTLQFFGGTTLADKVTAGLDKALTRLDGLKGKLSEVAAVAGKTIAATTKTTTPPPAKTTTTDTNFANLGGKSDIAKAKAELKKLADEIASDKLKGIDTSAKQLRYDQLKAEIQQATESLKTQKQAVDRVGDSLTTNERILKRLSLEMRQLGDKAPESLRTTVGLLQDLVDKEKSALKGAVDLGNGLKQIAPTSLNEQLAARLSGGNAVTQGLNGRTATVGLPGLGNFQAGAAQLIRDQQINVEAQKQGIRASMADIPAAFNQVRKEMNRLVRSDPFNTKGIVDKVSFLASAISSSVQGAKVQMAGAFGDLLVGIGESIGQGEGGFKQIIRGLINTIADSIAQIGKTLIITALPLLAFPATAALGVKQLIAGGAITLAAGLGRGLAAAAFANGGIVSGPTLGLVGEYVGARNNPEVIAPLNKLKDLLPGGGRDVRVRGELKLRNRELVAAIDTEREAQDYNS